MYSTLLYTYSNIKKTIFYISILLVFGCDNQMTSPVLVSTKHFKIQTSFMLDDRGIIINTYWGTEKKHYVLCLDNFSPSWIKSSLVHYNRSFTKSKNVSFKTYTADGSPIQGDVGICDSLSFENVVFKNVPFYVMPDNANDSKNDDGVLGIDAMSKGIWKIDFKSNQLAFASNIDSFKEISQSEIFPAIFDQQSIGVKVKFGNDNVEEMHIDLGYNGYMLLTLRDFKNISKKSRTYVMSGKFNTPAQQNFVNNLSVVDTIAISHNFFVTQVSSNEKVQERLIGLSFFKRFDYVRFDFINERIYIPKKVW